MKRKSKEKKSLFKEVMQHPITKIFGAILLGLAGLAIGRKFINN